MMTLARLGLLPVVVGLIWPGSETPQRALCACLVYIFAGVCDVIDGFVARRCNQVTALGKYLDPLVDKLFYLLTLLALLQLPGPWVPPWVVMLALARELAVTGLRGIASAEGIVLAAGAGGKLKTSFATAGMCGLLVHYPYAVDAGWVAFPIDAARVGRTVTYVSLFYSLTSAAGYLRSLAATLSARAP